MRFNPWLGLGEALERANRDWNTQLMPSLIAKAIEDLRTERAQSQEKKRLSFEERMEYWLILGEPTLTDDEMHAAKYAFGKVFAANAKARREEESEMEARFAATEGPLQY